MLVLLVSFTSYFFIILSLCPDAFFNFFLYLFMCSVPVAWPHSVCVYDVCIYIDMYVCHTYVCMHVCVCVCVCVSVSVCVCVCL